MADPVPCPAAVKKLRINAGLSPRELAIKAGIGTATLWRLEQGLAVARFATLRKLAAALDVPVSALLTSADEDAVA